MKRTCLAAFALVVATPLLADPPAQVMNIMREGELKFMPSKLVPGISQAVISGNPAKPGEVYVVRNRFAPGTFVPALVQIMGVGPSATIRVDEAGRPKDK